MVSFACCTWARVPWRDMVSSDELAASGQPNALDEMPDKLLSEHRWTRPEVIVALRVSSRAKEV